MIHAFYWFAVGVTMLQTVMFYVVAPRYLARKTWKWGVLFVILAIGNQIAMLLLATGIDKL
jgi:hypothetical protein